MKEQIASLLKEILAELGITGVVPEVTIPENPAHGDYTTNVAMKIWGSDKREAISEKWKTPMELALQVIEEVKSLKLKVKSGGQHQNINQKYQKTSEKRGIIDILQDIDRIEVAPPGFINLWLTEAKLSNQLGRVLKETGSYGMRKAISDKQKAKRIMVEFAHPNTHKVFHIGHLRNITTGEAIVRLLEATGHEVIRANYQGDVGLHIAKCLYGILQVQSSKFKVQNWKDARRLSLHERVEYLGEMYALGHKAYGEDPQVKKAIEEINRQIYAHDTQVYSLYEETRQWSLDYFANIYQRVGSRFDRLYFESEVYEAGKKYVLEALKKGIFAESEGAIIFPGEKYGLHNRVFVTGEGNATYEGKDIGLARLQFDEYHPDLIVHVVGPEQAGYFQVLFKALEQVFPDTKGKEYHLIYGWVRLKEGKMSSRTGNVVLGEWLLDEAKKEIFKILDQSIKKYSRQEQEEIAEKAAIGAVKYSFLRVATKQEIAFSLKESVNLEGDSGPYLQYTYARCKSVLRKAPKERTADSKELLETLNAKSYTLNAEERAVARLILYFPEIVVEAAQNLAPSALCAYLFALAQAFNFFYQKHTILGDTRQVTSDTKNKKANSGLSRVTSHVSRFRLALTAATAQVLQNGLYFLGIATLEQM